MPLCLWDCPIRDTFSKRGSLCFLTTVNVNYVHIFPGFPVITQASVSCLCLSVTHEALRIFGKLRVMLSSWEFPQSALWMQACSWALPDQLICSMFTVLTKSPTYTVELADFGAWSVSQLEFSRQVNARPRMEIVSWQALKGRENNQALICTSGHCRFLKMPFLDISRVFLQSHNTSGWAKWRTKLKPSFQLINNRCLMHLIIYSLESFKMKMTIHIFNAVLGNLPADW